jgi:hypothetical protein
MSRLPVTGFSVLPLLVVRVLRGAGEEVRRGVGEGVALGVGVMAARDDQHVRRSLGVDVTEGDGVTRGQHDVRGDVTGHDLAEQAVL